MLDMLVEELCVECVAKFSESFLIVVTLHVLEYADTIG
jgi:hypothetical protein